MPSSGSDWLEGLKAGIREHRQDRARLPRYEPVEKLGEGGMAVVYRGWDVQLGRAVAMKVLREIPGLTEEVRRRFEREARVTGGLSHPNVVALYDLLRTDAGFTLVMELVEGPPLSKILGERKLEMRTLIQILEKAARGVAAAHEKGIVHRDLKPANILVTPEGEPKVGDFGLAFVSGAEMELTKTGTPMGTPMYMAPEQVLGRKDITARTDVYGLGAILYEIATGRPPHTGESVGEVFARILRQEPIAPRKLNPRVSRDLETIALKAIEKDPLRRYASARNFAEDLKRYLDGDPISARPPGFVPRLVRWSRSHRALSLSTGAALLCLLTVGAVIGVRAIKSAQDTARRWRDVFRARASGDLDSEVRSLEVLDSLGDATAGRELERARENVKLAQNRDQATKTASRADERRKEHEELRNRLARLDKEIRDEKSKYKNWDPVEARERIFKLLKERDLELPKLVAFETEIVKAYEEAQEFNPADASIRARWFEFQRDRLRDAVDAGDTERIARLEETLRQRGGEAAREWLDRGGSLALDSDPPEAAVYLFHYEETPDLRLLPVACNPAKGRCSSRGLQMDDTTDRVLEFSESNRLGICPLTETRLARGSYLVVLRKEGYRDVRYPVFVERGARHERKVNLYKEEEIGRGFIYIPGGTFIMGGDVKTWDTGPRDPKARTDDFFISKLEVSLRGYLPFLNHVLEIRGWAEAQKRIPRATRDKGFFWDLEPEDKSLKIPKHMDVDVPLFGISWQDAVEFAGWLSDEPEARKRKVKYRLPTEREWEKAARGVDGRWFPWGNAFDWTFLHGGVQKPGSIFFPPGSFPKDESVYGVLDMAGGVREFCADRHPVETDLECFNVRGGAYSLMDERSFRVSGRYGMEAGDARTNTGFRLVREPVLKRK